MDLAQNPMRSRLPDPSDHPEIYDDTPMKRALAWVIDLGVIALATLLITLVTIPPTLFLSLFAVPAIWLGVGFCYRAATIARGGATWGMRLMSVELLGPWGERPDLGTALAHTALYYAAMALFPAQILSATMMVGTPRRQGLGDLLLGTAVVNRSE